MTNDWTEPHSWDGERSDHDRSEERWVQPWDEGEWDEPIDHDWIAIVDTWVPEAWLGWEYFDDDPDGTVVDFFSPRARLVSDRE